MEKFMLFEDYKKLMVSFKHVLKNYPENEESFKVHFALITMKIKDFETLKSAMMVHLSKSDWFPSHIDLIKNSIPALPDTSCHGIFDEKDVWHRHIKNILVDKFSLNVPKVGTWEYRMRTDLQVDKWCNQISKAFDKFEKQYHELSFPVEIVFNEDINNYLRLENG